MDATTTVDLWPKFKQHFIASLGLTVLQLFSYLFVESSIFMCKSCSSHSLIMFINSLSQKS